MALKFRNIDAHPSDPVETWPTEGVIAALMVRMERVAKRCHLPSG